MLEEIEEPQETLDQRTGREGDRERSAEQVAVEVERPAADPFEEVDFGSYFQDYLDPGYRTASTFEEYDSPSFEQFLASPSTLSDHLQWQIGAKTLTPSLRGALELFIGNLNEDGYLIASDDELIALGLGELWSTPEEGRLCLETARRTLHKLDPIGVGARDLRECLLLQTQFLRSARWARQTGRSREVVDGISRRRSSAAIFPCCNAVTCASWLAFAVPPWKR